MDTSQPFQAIIFDFDYTLADSSSAILRCINHGLESLGLPPAREEEALRCIGLSLPDTLRALTGIQDSDKVELFGRRFVELSDQITVASTHLLSGAREAVVELASRGYRLAIVSTKYRRRIEAVMQREAMAELFPVIVGGDDVSAPKPDPEGLCVALAKLGTERCATLYVGDSLVDAEAAAQAALAFVAVLSGVTPNDAFDGFPSAAVLPDVSELPAWLDGCDSATE